MSEDQSCFGECAETGNIVTRCENCRGSGIVRVATEPDVLADILPVSNAPIDAVYTVSSDKCGICGGVGTRYMGPNERIDLVQNREKVGTIPAARPSLSDPDNQFYQIRNGDYVLRWVKGVPFCDADQGLGLGDLQSLSGYIPATPTAHNPDPKA